jgi:hypothetical protein
MIWINNMSVLNQSEMGWAGAPFRGTYAPGLPLSGMADQLIVKAALNQFEKQQQPMGSTYPVIPALAAACYESTAKNGCGENEVYIAAGVDKNVGHCCLPGPPDLNVGLY